MVPNVLSSTLTNGRCGDAGRLKFILSMDEVWGAGKAEDPLAEYFN